MSNRKEPYTVFFQGQSIAVLASCVSDAIAVAVEQTGQDRSQISRIEMPDQEFGGTITLAGAALDCWL